METTYYNVCTVFVSCPQRTIVEKLPAVFRVKRERNRPEERRHLPGSIPEYSEFDGVVWAAPESAAPAVRCSCNTSTGFTWFGSNRSHWLISRIIWSSVMRSGLLILVRFFSITLPSSSLLRTTQQGTRERYDCDTTITSVIYFIELCDRPGVNRQQQINTLLVSQTRVKFPTLEWNGLKNIDIEARVEQYTE